MQSHSLPPEIFVTYFSAYSAHMVEYQGALYPTVEHAYHSQRYENPDIKKELLLARSPFLAWQISQQYKSQQLSDFSEHKVGIMEALCQAKLEQHNDVQRALIDSGATQIIKHITTGTKADGFWDDGEDGMGRNEAGEIWMRLRDRL